MRFGGGGGGNSTGARPAATTRREGRCQDEWEPEGRSVSVSGGLLQLVSRSY